MTKQLGLRMLVGLGVLVAVIFLVRGVGQHFHVAALPVLVLLSGLVVFALGLARQAGALIVAAGLVLLASGATLSAPAAVFPGGSATRSHPLRRCCLPFPTGVRPPGRDHAGADWQLCRRRSPRSADR